MTGNAASSAAGISYLTDPLTGILKDDTDQDQAKEEHLRKKYGMPFEASADPFYGEEHISGLERHAAETDAGTNMHQHDLIDSYERVEDVSKSLIEQNRKAYKELAE